MPHVNHGGGGPATRGGTTAAVAAHGPASLGLPHVRAHGAPPAPGRTGLALPGLAHPLLAPGEWAQPLRADVPVHWTVLSVDNGPGTRPDPRCLEAAGRLKNAGRRAVPGQPHPAGLVLGRLDLGHGARPARAVLDEARRYRDWYRVDGWLLHRCPCGPAALPHVTRLTAALRGLLEGSAHLVLGHGAHPDPGYAALAEQLVTFLGPWSRYRWAQAPEWTAALPPERFCHLVHGVPRTHLDEALRLARWHGAGTVLLTDRTARAAVGERGEDPTTMHYRAFETLPGYWDEIVSRIGRGVSE